MKNQHTILVVDDTKHILKLSKEIFEIAGYKVITAEDGQEALRILAGAKVDLVVTDILMPNVDGYMLCYTIRTTDRWKDLPVIIYSATYTSFSDEAMAMDLGADKFIRKPASMGELLAAVHAALSDTRKTNYKIPEKRKSLESKQLYSEGLVQKLEARNLELIERKEKLESGESRLKEAQTLAQLGNWEIDMVTNIHTWSDELFNLFGTDKKTPPSTELFLSFLHQDDVDLVAMRDRKARETFTDSSYDFRFIRSDGSLRNGFCRYRFEFGKNGQPVRLYGIIQDVTEKRRSEEALQAAHSRLLFHIENTSLGFIEWDNQLLVKSCSRRAEEILGWTEKELIDGRQTAMTTIFEDDLPWVSGMLQQLITGALERTKVENRNYTKEGKVIWCEWSNSALKDKEGKVTSVMSLVEDITDRKEAEQQREFDRNNLKALLNNTNDMIWSVDREFRLITSNHVFDDRVKALSGRSVTKGINVLETGFGELQLKRFRSYYERAFSGETFTEIEYADLPIDVWSEISYYPIQKDNEIIGTACFSRDITKQKKAENHLRLLESVITNSNDSVMITEAEPIDDPGPRIVYVNQAFTDMTGYEPEEVLGHTPRLLQGARTDRSGLDKIREALKLHKSVEVEIINYKKNGKEFWNNFAIVPVADKDGGLSHCISIHRDVTSRKRSEEITRARLERLVEERTSELHMALRKEKDLVEMKNKFVSIASHEFRTPLSTISFAAESIRNYFHQLTAEEIQRKLIKIEDQASHMTNLLEDILTIGKSEAGKIKVKRVSLDLKDFLEALIGEVRATVKDKRKINFIFSCLKRKVNVDDKLLRNIINNLLTNALKFSDVESEVSITVSDCDATILIEVTDQGIGIEESELASVFESFQRGSNASTVQGTGLGLSILKKAVELMDGSIEVKSKVNKGSTFSVRIPLQ